MTEYELLELMYETSYTISQDFEFFITITFALIVATYAVGDRLKLFPRAVIAVLYLCATYLFFTRYLNFMEQLGFIGVSLTALGTSFPIPKAELPGIARQVIYIAGSMAAFITLFWPIVTAEAQKEIEDASGA